MKRSHHLHHLTLTIIVAALALITTPRSHADDIELQRLLHGGTRCDHVIGLLMRYGVNNDSDAVAARYLPGPIQIPTEELGDLQLVSIQRHPSAAAGCGPALDVVIQNCSTRDVCGSRLTVVALLGRICPTSPNVTSTIDSLPAGEAVQVTVTLPPEALAMGNLNGQAIAFDRILVAVDSYDQFMESNEANNLRVLDATEVPEIAVTAASLPAEAVPAEAVPAEAVPAEAVPTNTAPANPAPAASDPGAMPNQPTPDQSQSDLQSAINQFSEVAAKPTDES
ncbi:hypothetical protein NHH03_23455 [Stieleria sp. TO1_6]|uniref:hypothetical protein n=1 Tax=Stieleria tagensis TaxID=2956795 RepID=UPI00209A97AD|nr:hypothetical protein [Stieleria tagensis]MCO8124716.1 hypothetical protein [Stieleria tagensis]